jgi:hypothetical protein
MKDASGARVSPYLTDLLVACCWGALLFGAQFVFRDDESLGHHAMHLGLWVSLCAYVAYAVRQHRPAG